MSAELSPTPRRCDEGSSNLRTEARFSSTKSLSFPSRPKPNCSSSSTRCAFGASAGNGRSRSHFGSWLQPIATCRKIDPQRFRQDLYHRLAVFLVHIPSLAERRDDIPELVQSFVRYFSSRVKKRITGMTDKALAAMHAYDYPGNVRELRNIVERAIILAQGPEITEHDLILLERPTAKEEPPPFFTVTLGPEGATRSLEVVEREYVVRVLEHLHGKRMAAAQALGISYPTFLKRLRELGLSQE